MCFDDVVRLYGEDLQRVEKYIEGHLHSYVNLIPQISHHIIASGGKRLRPLLLIICADLCGYRGDRIPPVATILEFIHTSSLLHDDVLDHATMRRGRTSANRIWGNYASVLAGDYMFSKAFKLLVMEKDLPLQNLLTTATTTMIEGELAQFAHCGDTSITKQAYFNAIERKTAVLISAACACGAILAGKPQAVIGRLSSFGMKLGMAFQLIDDILDFVAEERKFGKKVGTDIREGKVTLPLIKTMERCTFSERKLIKDSFEKEKLTNREVSDIIEVVKKYDGITCSQSHAEKLIEDCKKCLENFQDSEAKEMLKTAADYTLTRNR